MLASAPMRAKFRWVALAAAFGLLGCASGQIDVGRSEPIRSKGPLVVLPVLNASGAPLAGERAEAILTTLLRARGISEVQVHRARAEPGEGLELDDHRAYARALESARATGAAIGITGTVVEWGYRIGLDDRPAVSVSLRVVRVATGEVLWSASSARGGGGTVGILAQRVLRELTEAIPFDGS